MRITFLSPEPNMTGGERVVAIYAQRLSRRGHDVQIVCSQPQQIPFSGKLKSLVKCQGWPAKQVIGKSHYSNYGVNYRVADHDGYLNDRDVPDGDVVIATHWTTAEWASPLRRRHGVRCYFIQGDETIGFPGQGDYVARVLQTWQLSLFKITIAQWLVELGGVRCPGDEIALVPNSVDLEQFLGAPRGKQSVPTVGFMFSDAHFKGADLALDALSMARESMPNLRVLSFGCVNAGQEVRLPEWVEFTPNPSQPTITEIYRQCDQWLFASRCEGFGLPILEAMACRTPVIGTPTGAAPEAIGQGGGILVPHENPKAMAEAIVRIGRISDSDWRTMSDAAFRTAGSYTWEDAADRFEAAILRAVDISRKNAVLAG